MNISLAFTPAVEHSTPCLVVPIFQNGELGEVARAVNAKLAGLIEEIRREDGFKGALGETRVLYPGTALDAQRVVLVGLGKREKWNAASARKAFAKAARQVRALKKDDFAIAVSLTELGLDTEVLGAAITEGITLGLHRFDDYKTDAETQNRTVISDVTLLLDSENAEFARGLERAQIYAQANLLARDLVNRPSNLKSPEYLAQEARRIAAENGLRVQVWDENRIQAEKMGALWGVGMGSANPPRFIVLEYCAPGHEHDAPLVLVGKGMSFDTGGYSLKPSTSMEDMKDDMAGASVVLGAFSALKALAPSCRVLGLVPSAENMVSNCAQRPGDIVTARNGKTIEVLNTDAEGRLILADALSYASEQAPAAIVDFATLTGAIGVALGQEAAGLFANDDDLAARLHDSGEKTGDRLWRFPMWDEYREHVKGTISDLKNLGIERRAGSIAGAVFLEYFVGEDIPWAHIDMAAVALIREDRPLCARGATGYGVQLALDFVQNWGK